jgi:hypothetical protein
VAEVFRSQHFLFGFLHQLADVLDIGILQTILRAHGKLELIDTAKQIFVEWNRRSVFLPFRARLLLEINEDAHLILENLSGIRHRIIRFHAAIGMNFKDNPVVVGSLTDARIGHGEIHFLDRREHGIDKNCVNRRALLLVAFRRHVAPAKFDHHFHFELRVARQCRDFVLGIQNFDARGRADIFGVNNPGSLGVDAQRLLFAFIEPESDLF